MSPYLHCPTCQRAYNVASQPMCPNCGIQPGAPLDPVLGIVAAAEQLTRAIARASPEEIATAEATLNIRSSARRLELEPAVPGKNRTLLGALVVLLTRLVERPRVSILVRARSYLAR